MKRGERFVLALISALVVFAIIRAWVQTPDPRRGEIPYYSDADADTAREAGDLYKKYDCRSCHSLWTLRDVMQQVPSPILDGMGSLHSEDWLYSYLSSPNPQSILPSRLKPEYRMPSYAQLPEHERRVLAKYLASLKVKDWYLEETKKDEYEKLTGQEYHSE